MVVNYCHGEAVAAETAALCKEQGVEAVTVQADVSTAEGCKKLFEEAVNASDGWTFWSTTRASPATTSSSAFPRRTLTPVLNANLKGAFLCCKEAARRWCASARPHRQPEQRGGPAGQRGPDQTIPPARRA